MLKLDSGMPECENIITIGGLTKKFGRKVVLSDISMKINRGDSIAFIGRNGCGKSTLLKICAGLLPFEKGSVTHNGKLKFGYVPERFPAMNLTAKDYIGLTGRMTGSRGADVDKRSEQLFEALFMQDMVETPIRYLSKGTIQKLAVVQAFLTIPDVLLLDEPISGQDMASQRTFIEMVNSLNRDHGVAVLCSCHEDYMVKAIARSVYEIADAKLHQVELREKFEVDNFCRLLFIKKTGCETGDTFIVPLSIRDACIKTEQLDSREIAIYVEPADSDRVIREMLRDNFELRGLNNERLL